MTYLQERHAAGEIVTGLLYVDPEPEDLHQHMNTVSRRSTNWTRRRCVLVQQHSTNSTHHFASLLWETSMNKISRRIVVSALTRHPLRCPDCCARRAHRNP